MKSNKMNKRSKQRIQTGGDPWATVLPMEYTGGANKHYFESGSAELNTPGQHSVSHGSISADGMTAGPDLYPSMRTMLGGGHPRKNSNKRINKRKGLHKKTHKKTHKKSHKRSNRQSGGGCGCGGSTPQLAGNLLA